MMLTANQQRRMLFNPIQQSAGGWFKSLGHVANELNSGMFWDEGAAAKNHSVPWEPLLGSLFFLAVGCTAIVWAVRCLIRRVGRSSGGRLARAQLGGPPVPFYERFRAILARTGRSRAAAQTQREFAAALRNDWKSNGHAALGELPEAVTTAFYQIRFGAHPVPPRDLEALNASLDRFEQSFKNGATHGISQ
jgi:hypothetical protein